MKGRAVPRWGYKLNLLLFVAEEPDRHGSRNKRMNKLRGCAKASRVKKIRESGGDVESESVTYSGGYISDRVARSRRAKSLLYKLRLAAEQLNTECGWGVIIAAAAPVPKQGPRAAGL